MNKKKIALVACESHPLVKVGGLGDVVGALSRKLEKYFDVTLFLPAFRAITKSFPLEPAGSVPVPFSGTAETAPLYKIADPLYANVLLIGHEEYFGRENVYGYPDDLERFSFFSKAVSRVIADGGYTVVHNHDWQTALCPIYLTLLAGNNRPRSVFTIHNLSYQGVFPADRFPLLGLGPEFFRMQELEFFGAVNIMKGSLLHADAITTVSPTYAKEILRPEFGLGMESLLTARAHDLTGILNGMDYQIWNPVFDDAIAQKYHTREGKLANKTALQRETGLPENAAVPLFGMVGRFVEQKGSDLAAAALLRLKAMDFQAVFLGTGDRSQEEEIRRIAAMMPRKIAVRIAFHEPFSRRIYAGSDFFLMPSRFEPCGLSQLISLAYGTIPLARKTGGLADTIRDLRDGDGWGLLFEKPSATDLADAIRQAVRLYRDDALMDGLFDRASALRFSWDAPIERYREIYAGRDEQP